MSSITLLPATKEKSSSPSYIIILEHTLGNPMATDLEIARMSGRTQSFVQAVRKSDQFRMDLAKRVQDLYGEGKGKLREDLLALARKAVGKMDAALSAGSVSPDGILSILKEILPHVAAPAMPQTPQGQVNVNVIATTDVPIEVLQAARARNLERSTNIPVQSDQPTEQERRRYELPSFGEPAPSHKHSLDLEVLDVQASVVQEPPARGEVRDAHDRQAPRALPQSSDAGEG